MLKWTNMTFIAGYVWNHFSSARIKSKSEAELELTHHEQAREGTWASWRGSHSSLVTFTSFERKKCRYAVAVGCSFHPVFARFPHIAAVKLAKPLFNSHEEIPWSAMSSWLSKFLYFRICQSRDKFLDSF